MSARAGLFPTFFLSGFECSTFVWKDQGRRDLTAETQHREHAAEDYGILRELGIAVAREGVPWPLVERDGTYEFSLVEPLVAAARDTGITPIWDLCHYGYPDALDPFADGFADAFAAYCHAAATFVSERTDVPGFYTPINEITFFSFAAGEWAWAAPWGEDRETRHRLLLALCRASIAAVDAIRDVDPGARMVQIDPLIQVVAPRDRPDLDADARHENDEGTFLAWDILAGVQHPELGGSPEHLDIVGVNCYSFGQMEYREEGPHAALEPGDDRIVPLAEMLCDAWGRYHRPMIIAETSGLGAGRPDWLHDVMEEAMAAMVRGVDLHGVCLFPLVDMPNWHDGTWLHNGICDLVEDGADLRRVPFDPYVAELRRWQELLNRTSGLDDDPSSDPVDLAEVRAAAERLRPAPDDNWH